MAFLDGLKTDLVVTLNKFTELLERIATSLEELVTIVRNNTGDGK
jgi:hypothetical protein